MAKRPRLVEEVSIKIIRHPLTKGYWHALVTHQGRTYRGTYQGRPDEAQIASDFGSCKRRHFERV